MGALGASGIHSVREFAFFLHSILRYVVFMHTASFRFLEHFVAIDANLFTLTKIKNFHGSLSDNTFGVRKKIFN